MQARTIPLCSAVASVVLIGSATAQNCPNLGANGQEICVVASAGSTSPVIFRGPSPLAIPAGTVIGDYTIDSLTLTLSQGSGLAISASGTITKSGAGNTTLSLTAHGGLSTTPIGAGVKALSVVGTATGTSLIQIGGGAGFDTLGLGEPQIDPVLGSISVPVQNNSGFPLGFGDATMGEPVDAGAVSVALTVAININDTGDSVTIPGGAGVGPDGLAAAAPLGGESEYLMLPVPLPDGPVEYFSLDQFWTGFPSCPGEHYHSFAEFVVSIRGSQLSDPAPELCGYGEVSELEVRNVDLVAEDTTLTEDLTVQDGYDLVVGPDATLTIPEGIAAYVSGEVAVLGTLVVDGELLNADGGVLANAGTVIVAGLIVNNAQAEIRNDAGATLTNTGNTINNYGTITNKGTIDNTGRITNEPGGTITGDGTITGSAVVQIEDTSTNGGGTTPQPGCGSGGMCGTVSMLFLPMTLLGMRGMRRRTGRRVRR